MNSLGEGKRRAIQNAPFAEQGQDTYQKLLMDYLKLQKEIVSKKRKLQKQKEKREILRHEIAFLKRRHGYLSKVEHTDNATSNALSDLQSDMIAKERNRIINEVVEKSSFEQEFLKCNTVGKELGEKGEQMFRESNTKNGLTNDKRIGKKKITWHV